MYLRARRGSPLRGTYNHAPETHPIQHVFLIDRRVSPQRMVEGALGKWGSGAARSATSEAHLSEPVHEGVDSHRNPFDVEIGIAFGKFRMVVDSDVGVRHQVRRVDHHLTEAT